MLQYNQAIVCKLNYPIELLSGYLEFIGWRIKPQIVRY